MDYVEIRFNVREEEIKATFPGEETLNATYDAAPVVPDGKGLFGRLLRSPFQKAYWRTVNGLRMGQGLRLRLHLDDSPALAALPWEKLQDPEEDGRPWLRQEGRSLIYTLAAPHPVRSSKACAGPLRVLMWIAAPGDMRRVEDGRPLPVGPEWERMKTICDTAGAEVDQCAGSLDALRDALGRKQYHVLHFYGEGECRAGGRLCLEEHGAQSAGQEDPDDWHRASEIPERRPPYVPTGGGQIAEVLLSHTSLLLVVLMCCHGATVVDADHSVAAQLLRHSGVPAVLGMRGEVSDQAAAVFVAAFYPALLRTGCIEQALSRARLALWDAPKCEGGWSQPVLYLRTGRNGILFRRESLPPPAAQDPAAERAVNGHVVINNFEKPIITNSNIGVVHNS